MLLHEHLARIALGEELPLLYRGEPGDQVGFGLSSGDLDGDGDLDVILPAMLANERYGRVMLLFDTPDDPIGDLRLELHGRVPLGQFGFDTATADLNQDGHLDLAVVAAGSPLDPSLPGRVHVFPGPVETMGWDTAVTWKSPVNYRDSFGYEIATADMDGDGFPELLVGAPYNNELEINNGAVYSIARPLEPPPR